MKVLINPMTGQPTVFTPPEWLPLIESGPYRNVAEVTEESVKLEWEKINGTA